MKETEHYGLHTWKREDGASLEALNGNFEAIDEVLAGLEADKLEVVFGMYQGTGESGSVTVELGFRPRALIASAHGSYNKGGGSGIYTMFSLSENSCEFLTLTDTGFTASQFMCYAQSNSNPYRYAAFR